MTNDDIANLSALVEQKAIMKALAFMIMYNTFLTSFFGYYIAAM